jgi:hypothetical protein
MESEVFWGVRSRKIAYLRERERERERENKE